MKRGSGPDTLKGIRARYIEVKGCKKGIMSRYIVGKGCEKVIRARYSGKRLRERDQGQV